MYNLSDEVLEKQICDRLSFRHFIGLGMMDDVPDTSTFCRFRQDLPGQKLSESLFHIVLNGLLKKGDFKQGVCVDAAMQTRAIPAKPIVPLFAKKDSRTVE